MFPDKTKFTRANLELLRFVAERDPWPLPLFIDMPTRFIDC